MDGLQFQFVDAWPLVLRTVARFFQCYGAHGRGFMGPALASLAELRDSEQFTYTAELESAIGSAVSALGPRLLIENVPLKIAGDASDDQDFPRSWLLPVLRTSVKDTEIAFFADYFLPLTKALKSRAVELETGGDKRMCRIYHTLELQVWELLPGFCTGTTDLPANLKRVARVLGSLLTERSDLRLLVLNALRLLVHKSSDDAASRAEVARFAKNYLPILFNLYMTLPNEGSEAGHRAAVFETVSAYLTLADDPLIVALVDKALSRLSAADTQDQDRARMLDLVRCMLPHMDGARVTGAWAQAASYMESEEGLTQKTAYRLLEEICHSKDEGCITFVQENYMDLMTTLKRSLAKATSSAKTTRLACLSGLLDHLDASQEQFVAGVLPEAVACCKEHNEKSRAAAFKLIVKIGETLQRWAGEADKGPGEAMRTYMQLLLAGMTGSPKMIAATLLATAQVIHEFKDVFPPDLLDLVMDNVCLLLTSSSREPAEACLSLIKALVFAIDPVQFAKYLPKLMKALSMMTNDCKRHFRQKTRDLLSVFVRKFGFDVIFGLAPSGDAILQKRLKNIKKLEVRKKANRESRRQQDGSDEEGAAAGITKSVDEILEAAEVSSDEEGGPPQPQRPRQKKSAAWIREDAGSIVDLLDPKASRQVTASRPQKDDVSEERRRRRRAEFGLSDDGRLIIGDDDEDDDLGARSSDEEDDPDEFLEAIRNTAGRKRKLDSSSQGTASEAAPASKYQAGGGGIHRRVAGAGASSVKSGRSGRSQTGSVRFGSEYSSGKGRGDVKRAGRPDPYAYVPLKRNTLNKRKKAKFEGQYKNIVRGAQKGATKAAKARGRSRKR